MKRRIKTYRGDLRKLFRRSPMEALGWRPHYSVAYYVTDGMLTGGRPTLHLTLRPVVVLTRARAVSMVDFYENDDPDCAGVDGL